MLIVSHDGISHLSAGSPAVDACNIGLTSSFDLEGYPRLLGAGVDMGAFESTLLFREGFEQ